MLANYGITLELLDINDDSIILKLTKNTFFKVLNGAINYNWEPQSGDLFLEINVYGESEDEAENKIFDIINFLSFLYGYDLLAINNLKDIYEFSTPIEIEHVTNSNRNFQKLKIVEAAFNDLKNEDQKKVTNSIKYFARGIRLTDLELYEEAYLTFYKAIELIVNHLYTKVYAHQFEQEIENIMNIFLKNTFNESYQGKNNDVEIYKSIHKSLLGAVTARRKLIKVISHLDISELEKEAGKVVQKRNKIAAHANTKNNVLDINDVMQCGHLASRIISGYLLGKKYNQAFLNGEKK
ncbi:hypothetical protein [Sutcliffiella horikoshii]|uniref:hypothetical protein n=1 Tax=Sutcliffiella horikoshii TaxID=79883 RepID=UPI001CFF2B44|nr:hypothetical protein [Sutcliffiella horikoshii]